RTARECDAAVDDEELAVRAVVETRQAVPHDPLIRLDATASFAERLRAAAKGAEAADGVHDDGDADAGAPTLGQRVDELLADLALLEDVALHVDRLARAADGVEHRRIERVPVREDLDPVAALELGV